MDIKEDIKPISYIKTNAADILKRVNETHHPMIITKNGKAKAVLLDIETYQSMINSMGILKVLSQSEQDIEKEKVKNEQQVFQRINKKIEAIHSKE